MPIRIPNIIPGTVSTATATAADLTHGAQGLGRLASGIADLGQTFQTIADREQSIVNARHESETRLAIQTEHADFLQKLSQNNNPEDYLPAYETHAAKLQTYLQNDDHSPQTNQRLHLWLNQYTGQNKIHVAELAHNLNRKRASLALDNELTAAKNSGDQYAYESALNLGTESGLLLPEQKQKLLTDYQTETTYNTITAQIDTDPAAALEQLSSEDIQTRYPTLGKENIARLTAYATKRKHEDTSLIMDRLTMDAIDGKYLPEEEIKKLHTDGTLTAAQASAYISRARSAAPPEYDATSYDLAQKTILTYDPKQDPDGFQLATLRTQLATLPLPPEHIKQLKENLDQRTTNPDSPKHKLASYFHTVIESDWKAEAFGEWFDMVDDPTDTKISRKVIKHDQYASALDYKLRLEGAFHTWLTEQPDTLTPEDAMKKYRELKTAAASELPPINLAPPPVQTYNPDLYLDELPPDQDTPLQDNQDPASAPTTSAIPAKAIPAPLRKLQSDFEAAGAKYGVDPRFLMAISMHETANGTSRVFREKNNAMGVSNSKGAIAQPSHAHSIEKMARLLGSTSSGPYKRARTIGEIARIYAPVGAANDPRALNGYWAKGVMNNFLKLGGDPNQKIKGLHTIPTTSQTSIQDLKQQYFDTVKPTSPDQISADLAALTDHYYTAQLA